jgi:dGTPase
LRVVEILEKDGQGLNLTLAVRDGILCHTNRTAHTKEGCVVRLADRIAYINHDIEDAIRAGILCAEALPKQATDVLGTTKSQRITALVSSVIAHGSNTIGMDHKMEAAQDLLHQFLFANVYYNPIAKQEEQKAQDLLRRLYGYYFDHPEKLPQTYQCIAQQEDLHRGVCDYISGMSDGYAIDLYRELFVPKAWK